MTATPSFLRPRTWLLAAASVAALGSLALQPAFADNDDDDDDRIKPAQIATQPLYSNMAGDRPTLLLVPSVEYPTVGQQYTSTNYNPDEREFVGYYNNKMCYEYDAAGQYFKISGAGTLNGKNNASCSGDAEFSGAFLNWATGSSMDMVRLALTGGDRVVDTEDTTVLQRAWLPQGTADVTSVKLWDGTTKDTGNKDARGPHCFFKFGGQFDTKTLKKSDDAAYYGAIPKKMIAALEAQGATVLYVNNVANRIHFGVHAMTGLAPTYGGQSNDVEENKKCTYGPYNYALGAGGGVNEFHSVRRNAFWSTNSHTKCDYNKSCTADSAGQRVWFGDGVTGHRWITGIVKGTFTCGGDIFKNADRHLDTAETDTPFDNSSHCYLESKDAILAGDDFFYARVKVCDELDKRDYKDARDGDFGYCAEYPSGYKKPQGTIQRYADSLRVGAFAYAIDPTAAHGTDSYKGRFGGVLRAPMKYVGQNTYSTTGVKSETPNPKMEWDPETGVLVENPEGDTEFGVSGVINYFNRFGRNPKNPGNYKQYDNVAELYYEALRYLQGLAPSDNAVKNLDSAMKDGFPAYTSWAGLDPFDSKLGYSNTADYACLNNSLLLVGDINTHDAVNGNTDALRHTMANGKDATGGWDFNTNAPDLLHWRKVVRAFEEPKEMSYVDGQGVTRTTSNPYSQGFDTTVGGGEKGRNMWSLIPGLAYWAHTHDIRAGDIKGASGEVLVKGWKETDKQRPGLRLTSYFVDVNESGMMGSYGARVGSQADDRWSGYWGNQYWLGAKYGGFLTSPRSKGSTAYNTTGNPFYGTSCSTTTDADGNETETCTQGAADNNVWSDLKKAQGDNTNGKDNPEPRTYYMPSAGRDLIKAFDEIFGSQDRPSNRSIAGADSSGGIGGTSFQAEFDGSDWSGDVIAETIGIGGGTEKVRAAAKLEGKSATRNIIMAAHDATSDGANTTAFEFKVGSVPSDVTAALRAGGCTGDDAADCINWLRGDRSKEGTLRTRTEGRLLGDIINSGVKYVGAPAGQVNLGLGYDDFVGSKTFRTAALYVGANDGMLHAFHAGGKEEVAGSGGRTTVRDSEPTLEELFAYIPSWMKGKLADLTSPTYAHQAYVDATPVIGDANLKADCTDTNGTNDCDWRSVLVGGTGGGGRGVYALDVTDPDNFTTESVLWEFTDADDPDMGYVLGQARIVKLLYTPANTTTNTPAVYRWFAMVPAGVNNYVGGVRDDDDDDDDDDARKGNGDANIFLLALDKAAGAKWTLNSNYWKLRLPRIEALQANYPTGILNLEAFTGLGGVTEYVYAGDLHGQLWAFSFKDMGSSDWTEIKLSNLYNNGTKIKPLYIAKTPVKDGKTEPQPITVAPTILEGAGNGVHFVSFGTGKYFEPTDAQSTKIDTFYTVYSNFNTKAEDLPNRTTGEAIIPGRNYLQEVVQYKTEDEVNFFKPSQAFFWDWLASAPTAGDTNPTRSGWYLDFVERSESGATSAVGERQIADASWISLTSRLMFSTLTPTSATNTGVCGTGGGDSKLYTFDMISGMGTGRHSAVGMLAQPLVFLDTANTRETQADSTGRRLRISPVMSGQFGADGSNVSQVDTVIVPFGRLSWRRIDNFQELKHEEDDE